MLPHFNQAEVVRRRVQVLGPRIVSGNAGEVKVVLTNRRDIAIRTIQNCGTAAVKYAVNTNPNANEFHGILAGCAAEDDGLGSVLNCSDYIGEIRVFSADAWRVCVFEALQ